MSNNLLTISKITNEALMVLENELVFSRGVDRTYDDQFAQSGAKIGNTLNVRKPARFIGASGPALAVEDFYESSVPIVLGDTTQNGAQFQVATQFTTQDLALSMDMFSSRFIRPAVAAVANKIDRDGLLMAKNAVGNVVGTPGSVPTSPLIYLNAGALITSEAGPQIDRSMVVEPFTSVSMVDSLKGMFNPVQELTQQYRKGSMGHAFGFNWDVDQNIVSHTYGSWATTVGTLTANTTSIGIATGWASTSTITLTNSQTLTLQKGDKLTIANVYGVNPQNRQSYGQLRSFSVQALVTGAAGSISVVVSPAIITAGQFQNVTITSTSATAAVTVLGIAGTTATALSRPMNIAYQKQAFALATADLPLPRGVDMAGRQSDKESGLSIRIVRQYTINNDSMPARVEVLYGWAPLYPELACIVAS